MKKWSMILLVISLLGGCVFSLILHISDQKTVTATGEMEPDYVYMWNQSGSSGSAKILKFQTEKYALATDAKGGAIKSLGAYAPAQAGAYTRADFDQLLKVADMKYMVTTDGKNIPLSKKEGYHRVIESGRYLQRADYNDLRNFLYRKWTGRMEIAATLDYFSLNYEVHNGMETAAELGLRFEIRFEEALQATEIPQRGLTLRSKSGQGISIIRAAGEEDVSISYDQNTLTVKKDGVRIPAGAFAGFGVLVIPSGDAKPSDVSVVQAMEAIEIHAKDFDTEKEIPVSYDANRGIYRLDISEVGNAISQSTQEGRNTYERVRFTLANAGDKSMKVPISFVKNREMSVTGMSPMIRDAVTFEPTGIQVQISKNWHTNPNTGIPPGDPSRYLEGQWYSGNTAIPVPAGESVSYEYTCAYGMWGGVPAVSHGQLCLIGWGGTNNLLWEESALGSWGESVTYDPDVGLGRSMIDDVRPFLVKSKQSDYRMYDWTGNVGGANFLDYYPARKKSNIVDQTVVYRTQAPNLTDVTYQGITGDGAIETGITINMGRTDDVVRVYYTIQYTFLKDTTPKRLSFFKLCADQYADNSFTRYALGDENGVIQEDADAIGGSSGYRDKFASTVSGEDFWFTLYGSTDELENADVAMIVRSYHANLNGQIYERPSYRIYGTDDYGMPQASCEITLPDRVKTVKAGSTVEMTVEYLVLPAERSMYYGSSEYLLQKDHFGTPEGVYDQVTGGRLSADVSVGTLVNEHVLTIEAESGNVAAQFTLTGGLGYTPVRIQNLDRYTNYRLQERINGQWVDVVQSGSSKYRNDYWQMYFNASTGKYDVVYNVENTVGAAAFRQRKEYRLVQTV